MLKLKWLALIFLASFLSSSRPADKETIHWLTVSEMNALYAKEPRPVLVDVYTDWCGWCKQMDKTTYQHKKLVQYINEHFYAVKYNAESKEDVSFNGQVYTFSPELKTNQFALYLSFGKMEYPCTVFLASPSAQPAPLPGYMKPKEMEAPLKFFGEKADATQTFVEFNRSLKKEW